MNPTDSQIAFRLRKLKTHFNRLDIDNNGYISREDYELLAKKVNELSKATGDKAERCYKAFIDIADSLGFTPGVKIPKEEAVKKANEMMLTKPWEEQRVMCDRAHNLIFDAVDLNGDGHISMEEFKIYFHVLAPNLLDADKEKSFKLIDVDKNGEISREEFLQASFEYLHGVKENELSQVFYGPLEPWHGLLQTWYNINETYM